MSDNTEGLYQVWYTLTADGGEGRLSVEAVSEIDARTYAVRTLKREHGYGGAIVTGVRRVRDAILN